jgi:hypothetical protein
MKPLMTSKCISLLEKYMSSQSIMLEVGSGGSTCYFCNKVNKIYSIETDKEWYNKVKHYLDKNNIVNVDYKLIESDLPDSNRSERHTYWTYKMYKTMLDEIENHNQKFDIVLVDGRARRHVYAKSFNVLKDDGVLFIHDFYSRPNRKSDYAVDILFKYYDEIESIKEYRGFRGNDVIALRKKIGVQFSTEDFKKLDYV